MSTTTRVNKLAVGTSIASVLTTFFGAGYLFLQGDLVTDSTQNTVVNYYYGTGSYLSYTERPLSASGANRFGVQIQNDSASGSILHSWAVECNNKPVTQNFDIALTRLAKAGTGNGINVASDKSLVDGGAMSGSIVQVAKWPANWYFTVLSSSGSAASQTGDCMARIWYRSKYGK